MIYEIARDRRDEDGDEPIGRLQLLALGDGSLRLRRTDGRETSCAEADLAAAIAANPDLHSISPYDVTQLRGRPDVVDRLPLLLRMQDGGHPPESYEVFVDDGRWDERWDVLETTEGLRLIPDGYNLEDTSVLADRWIEVRLVETADRASASFAGQLGLITPSVIAGLYVHDGDTQLAVFSRDDDVEAVTNWLVRGGFRPDSHPDDRDRRAMLVRLFVDAASSNASGVTISGERLAASVAARPDTFGANSTAEWSMTLSLGAEIISAVLGRVGRLDACLADIVAAPRNETRSSSG